MLVVTELSSLASPSVILMDTSKVFVNMYINIMSMSEKESLFIDIIKSMSEWVDVG